MKIHKTHNGFVASGFPSGKAYSVIVPDCDTLLPLSVFFERYIAPIEAMEKELSQ